MERAVGAPKTGQPQAAMIQGQRPGSSSSKQMIEAWRWGGLSALIYFRPMTWGVAPGWDGDAPLALSETPFRSPPRSGVVVNQRIDILARQFFGGSKRGHVAPSVGSLNIPEESDFARTVADSLNRVELHIRKWKIDNMPVAIRPIRKCDRHRPPGALNNIMSFQSGQSPANQVIS